jgi:hypothetical protein
MVVLTRAEWIAGTLLEVNNVIRLLSMIFVKTVATKSSAIANSHHSSYNDE